MLGACKSGIIWFHNRLVCVCVLCTPNPPSLVLQVPQQNDVDEDSMFALDEEQLTEKGEVQHAANMGDIAFPQSDDDDSSTNGKTKILSTVLHTLTKYRELMQFTPRCLCS